MITTKDIFIYFDETDFAGILFHGSFFAYTHRLLEDFIRTSSIGWERWFRNDRWFVPVRHTEAEYLHPLKAGGHYLLALADYTLGEHSVIFEYHFYDHQKVLCGKMKIAHVFVEKKQFQKIKVPQDIRKALEMHRLSS